MTVKTTAYPFVKWAGGKRGLIQELSRYIDYVFSGNKTNAYIEPFVGGGALLFHVLSNYTVNEVVINDINKSLINCYKQIQQNVEFLIGSLNKLENTYNMVEDKKAFYLDMRQKYNRAVLSGTTETVENASLFLFLNRLCFNGLYRVNKSGGFNVPFGDYKNPTICDAENLLNCHALLQNVVILNGDYKNIAPYIKENSLVYLDPPYRPLKGKNSFTTYDKNAFTDKEQSELKEFADNINSNKAFFLLSNSDPKIADECDNFFDNLYNSYNVERVFMKRNINSKGDGRGSVSEILVTNISTKEKECKSETSKPGSLHLETA